MRGRTLSPRLRIDWLYWAPRGESMIFDLRIYTLHNNKFAAWLKLYEEYGHPTQVKHCGEPVFYATTEVGTYNQVVHVWMLGSQGDLENKLESIISVPVFSEYHN